MIFTRERKETWSLINKIGFRFLFIYFSFYSLSLFASGIFESLVHYVGKTVFSISYSFSSRGYGSGDTTYQYILLFIIFCISIFGTIVWSVFDKRKSYNQLNYTFSLALRIILVFYLFIYGFIKIFHLQMIPPTYGQLLTNLGEMSPMRLAWTFMGYSKAYSIFAGASEVIAGLLLISRRTQTIGAILAIAVMGNVFMMNMAFDIPVKIFSFHLLLMGVILFLSDSRRFVNAIIYNKTVPKNEIYPPYTSKTRMGMRIVKAIITVIAIWIFLNMGFERSASFYERMNPPLKGAWKIIRFEKNGIELPPLTTDVYRWNYLILDQKDRATILRMNGDKEYYQFSADTIAKSWLVKENLSEIENIFSYTKEGNYIKAEGVFLNDTLKIELVRKKDEDFYLKSRGFHWINELPNNR